MTLRYVGPGGNDANSGLSWGQRKLTLTGVEDTPIVAGDQVYVGPGVYRETLTVDVSGAVGSVITYIGDVSGEHTDGVGGVVRITGSNNDQTIVRNNCITATAKNYRTFRGFLCDSCIQVAISTASGCTDWTVEDCTILDYGSNSGISVAGAGQANWIIRRCVIMGLSTAAVPAVYFFHTVAVDDANHLVQNCHISNRANPCIWSVRISGIFVRNCYLSGTYGVYTDSITVGKTITVNNCILHWCGTALRAGALGQITENFNDFWGNAASRTNVAVGANSTAYPPVLQPPVFNSGVGQLSGFQLPWFFGTLSSWSQIRAIAGASEATEDLFGLARPVAAALNSWGPVQYQQVTQDTATVRTGTLSQEFTTAGRRQLIIPVQAVNTTISVYVYREANYAGINPQMILKQSGQADITVTDAGGLSAWNQLTHTWIPATVPTWIAIELVSNNTAAAGAFAVYFDDLTVSPLDTDTMEAWLSNEQPVNYAEELAAAAGTAFSPVGGTIVGA